MNEGQFPGRQDDQPRIVRPGQDMRNGRGTEDRTATMANMDKYDYINLLAEARIVDMAWIR